MKDNLSSNFVSRADSQIAQVINTNRNMTENSLRMRVMAYMAQVKANLLTETIYGINQDKKLTTNIVKTLEGKNKQLEEQKRIIKEQNEELDESKKRLEMAMECGELGSWDIDFVNDKLVVNDIWASMLGYNMDELKDATKDRWIQTIHPQDRERVLQFGEDYRNGKVPVYNIVYRALRKNGELLWLLSQGTAVQKDKNNTATRMVGIVSNITNDKLYKERLRTAKEKAEDAVKAKSSFLANMSHEIRTPLNAIMGFIDLLLEKEDDKVKQKYLNVIKGSSNNLLEIINDILDFSKIESGKLSIERVDFDPLKEFHITKKLFKAKALEKGIHLYAGSSELPKSLNGDILRIKQVINNLMSNAVKFTPEGKSIYLDIEYVDGYLRVKVKDEGIGISEEFQKELFEKFSQEDASITRKYGGTGLGLAISYELVKLMNGELKVKSKLGEGSEFFFSIPLKAGGPVAGRSEKNRITPLKGHILLVEDVEENKLLMEVILTKFSLSYDTAGDGKAAVKLSKQNSYDAILMDENMPEMNGIEATKKIIESEKHNKLPHTPIIALTANALKGDKEKFIAAGMDDYITKPVDMQRLHEILLKFLPQKTPKEDLEETTEIEKSAGTLPEFKTLDKEYGLNLVMGMENVFIQVLKGLVSYKDKNYGILNDEELKRTAHSLKGLTASAGALELSELANQIELTLDREILPIFTTRLNEVIEEIELKLPDEKIEKKEIDNETRDQLFGKLKAAVETKRAKNCKAIIDELERYNLSQVDQKLFEDIKTLASKFKFKDASKLF